MRDIDFVRDGRVGDKVYDPRFGNGLIAELNEGYNQPVWVRFENRSYLQKYYAIGLWSTVYAAPTLCWGHRVHLDQGQPPERFEYPLYMKSNSSELVVEFTGLRTGTVLVASIMSDSVGTTSECWDRHTNTELWSPCDKPRWKPIKPTWCLVSNGRVEWLSVARLVINYIDNSSCPYTTFQGHQFRYAVPCNREKIPGWWPNAWV